MAKLIDLEVLDNFKSRQDKVNDEWFLKRSNVVASGNDVKIVAVEASDGVSEVSHTVLTPESTLQASKVSGVLSISNIPASAQERLVKVANAAARKQLTTNDVQLGDVVQENDTLKMYFVIDTSKLNTDAGYQMFVAGSAASVPWSGVTDKPSSFTPASHTHGNITNAGAIGSTANLPVITGTNGVLKAGSFGTTANTFCQGNDSRLSDSRTPTSHVHGNITNAGAIGSTANLPVITGTNGVLKAGSFGTTANTFCQGNDSRLSDSRTPTSHTHGNISNDGKISSGSSGQALVWSTGGAPVWGTPATATTATKLSNTSKVGDTNLPVYFTASGVPSAVTSLGNGSMTVKIPTSTPSSVSDGMIWIES